MRTALIIHGMPSKKEYFDRKVSTPSNSHWLPWIQKQLILKGILAQTIEFPEPYKPVYKKWETVLNQFKIDKNTILIGHSLGAGFIIKWLRQNKLKVGRVILVAPYIDPDHKLKTKFFNFKIDSNLLKRIENLVIFVSKDDYRDVVKSAKLIKNALKGANIEVKEFKNKGHFTLGDMKTEEFPELMEEVLK